MLIDAQNTNITYIGRWADKILNSHLSKVAITNGRMRFKFTGSNLSIAFSQSGHINPPEIEYSFDGGSFSRRSIFGGILNIVADEQNTEHTFDMWICGINQETNRWIDNTGVMIEYILVDDNSVITPFPTDNKIKMLVLGDSIAEGILMLNSDTSSNTGSWGRKSFISQVAENMHIDCWNHSFGGAGFDTEMFNVPRTDINYDYKMGGILKQDPQYDIIFIESINNGGNPTNISINYNSLIDKLKIDQPKAKIICMSPIGNFGQNLHSLVEATAIERGLYFISTLGWTYSYPNLGHPDLQGHNALATYVQQFMQPIVQQILLDKAPKKYDLFIRDLSGSFNKYIINTSNNTNTFSPYILAVSR